MGKDKRKPLIELDNHYPKGKTLKFWWSAKEAAEFYGFRSEYISLYLNARVKSCRGKFFRYATAEEIQAYKNLEVELETADNKATVPVEQPAILPDLPIETIPDIVEKPLTDDDFLTPFERLLRDRSKKLNENS